MRLAAGTIAQVHRATLESGDRVVVKVQRPTAEQDILQDLRLLEMFGAKAAERPALRRLGSERTVVRQGGGLPRRRQRGGTPHVFGVIRRWSLVCSPGRSLQDDCVKTSPHSGDGRYPARGGRQQQKSGAEKDCDNSGGD